MPLPSVQPNNVPPPPQPMLFPPTQPKFESKQIQDSVYAGYRYNQDNRLANYATTTKKNFISCLENIKANIDPAHKRDVEAALSYANGEFSRQIREYEGPSYRPNTQAYAMRLEAIIRGAEDRVRELEKHVPRNKLREGKTIDERFDSWSNGVARKDPLLLRYSSDTGRHYVDVPETWNIRVLDSKGNPVPGGESSWVDISGGRRRHYLSGASAASVIEIEDRNGSAPFSKQVQVARAGGNGDLMLREAIGQLGIPKNGARPAALPSANPTPGTNGGSLLDRVEGRTGGTPPPPPKRKAEAEAPAPAPVYAKSQPELPLSKKIIEQRDAKAAELQHDKKPSGLYQHDIPVPRPAGPVATPEEISQRIAVCIPTVKNGDYIFPRLYQDKKTNQTVSGVLFIREKTFDDSLRLMNDPAAAAAIRRAYAEGAPRGIDEKKWADSGNSLESQLRPDGSVVVRSKDKSDQKKARIFGPSINGNSLLWKPKEAILHDDDGRYYVP